MLKKDSFKVAGLDCQEEVSLLKKTLASREGVLELTFDVMQARMEVTYEEKKITSDEIISNINAAGLRAALWAHRRSLDANSWWGLKGRLFMTICSGCFIIFGFFTGDVVLLKLLQFFAKGNASSASFPPFLSPLFYGIAIACGLWHVVPKAFNAIKRLRADMNLLMLVASIGAMVIGQWFEGASVVFLFSVSLLLEQASMKRARKAVTSLLDLTPCVAHVILDSGVVDKRLSDLKIGDMILVKASEKVPIDAVITKGKTMINQAPITGESMPVEKQVNDEVFAGTINEEASFECKVTKLTYDTTLAKMIHMIEHAQSKRAQSEKSIEKFAAIYTPVMIALALVIGILPPLLFDAKWFEWIYRGLVVLVIACPCALVISTPVCLISGITSAAREGVLIKGGIFLEIAKNLKVIAFDKTGTLTYGKPSIQKMIPLNGYKEEELLMIAAALEKGSTHPLGKAIIEKAIEKNIKIQTADHVKIIQGKGIEGVVNEIKYWMGSHRFMHEKSQETKKIHQAAEELEDAGHTVVAMGNEKKIIGLISIADQPRSGMADLMNKIRACGIKRTIMLTGDNTKCAKEIAAETKVDEFYSELLPEDKLNAINLLKEKYGPCAMIGDGVNDAPAMATADLGIAMGAIGTDVAIETADIALMQDDLSKLPWLILHSKRTMAILRQNISFSLSIKVIVLALATLGFAGLWMAIVADTGASLLVVMNALRLLKKYSRHECCKSFK